MVGLDGKQIPDTWEHTTSVYPRISYWPVKENSALYWELNKSYRIQVMPDADDPINVDKLMVSVDYTDYSHDEHHTEENGYGYLELPKAYAMCVKLFNAYCDWKEEYYGK